jgi:hypothetical protein
MPDFAARLQPLQYVKWMIFSKNTSVGTNQERRVLCNRISGPCCKHGMTRDFDIYRTLHQLNTRLRVLSNLEEEYWKLFCLQVDVKANIANRPDCVSLPWPFLPHPQAGRLFDDPFFSCNS